MFDGLALQHSHGSSHTQAVVGTQSGVARIYPTVNNLGLDGVFQKIVHLAGTCLGHHVHVGLQHHGAHILHTGSGGFPHDDIANVVHMAFNFVLLCPVNEIIAYSLFVLRGAGATGEVIEITPQFFWF